MSWEVTVQENTPFQVRGRAVFCGRDLAVTLCGGTREHLGAVSLAVYEPERDSATVSTLTVYSHRDDAVSAEAAKLFARSLRCTATVAVGIHLDDADPQALLRLREAARACCRRLLEALPPGPGA